MCIRIIFSLHTTIQQESDNEHEARACSNLSHTRSTLQLFWIIEATKHLGYTGNYKCLSNDHVPSGSRNDHVTFGRNKLSSLKGSNTYNVRCINVDSVQEVTDSLYLTISRCFPQLHFLYWWRGWRSNAPSILIPTKLISNPSGDLPYTMVLHIDARLKSATYCMLVWCVQTHSSQTLHSNKVPM